MEHPSTKIAPCLLYFGAHGGRFDELGRILKNVDVDEYEPTLCPVSIDCGQCPFMHEWIKKWAASGYSISWECIGCIKATEKTDEANNIERILPGYYQAGRKFDRTPDDPDYDQDRPALEGCIHVFEKDNPDVEPPEIAGQVCGNESSFLQLIFRKRRNE